jgi:hypothetical protein
MRREPAPLRLTSPRPSRRRPGARLGWLAALVLAAAPPLLAQPPAELAPTADPTPAPGAAVEAEPADAALPSEALPEEALPSDPHRAETPTAETPAAPVVEVLDLSAPPGPAPPPPTERPRRRDLCQQPDSNEDLVEESSVLLAETFCTATLWFDGLFGGEPDLANARAVSGRIELFALHTDFYGDDYNARLRVNYDLPNLERRVRLFLGREPDDDFVSDRREGFAIQSSVFGIDNEDEWLAGLGWKPPGRWLNKVDVRLGGRLKAAPEVFVQTRYRYNKFVGERTVWRFRETVFWENREGYGSTTSIDWDRVLQRDLLVRWANVGTWSEKERQGMEWRSAAILYRNLRRSRALAAEVFTRGATGAEVKLREYGTRLIYRQPLRRPYLFGELVAGYTWPRHEIDQQREPSAMIGFGVELLFGNDPY